MVIKFIFLIISLELILEFCIEFENNLPNCRWPKFIVPFLKYGISKIPLEEFPIIPSEWLKNE